MGPTLHHVGHSTLDVQQPSDVFGSDVIIVRKHTLIGTDSIQLRHSEVDRLGFAGLDNLLHAHLVDRESLFLLCMVRDGERDNAELPSLIYENRRRHDKADIMVIENREVELCGALGLLGIGQRSDGQEKKEGREHCYLGF